MQSPETHSYSEGHETVAQSTSTHVLPAPQTVPAPQVVEPQLVVTQVPPEHCSPLPQVTPTHRASTQ